MHFRNLQPLITVKRHLDDGQHEIRHHILTRRPRQRAQIFEVESCQSRGEGGPTGDRAAASIGRSPPKGHSLFVSDDVLQRDPPTRIARDIVSPSFQGSHKTLFVLLDKSLLIAHREKLSCMRVDPILFIKSLSIEKEYQLK